MSGQPDTRKLEEFVRWFLRFNGYFGIENFIVHAADDPSRISGGVIAPYTETDTIAIRMPYPKEITGSLRIANYDPLVGGGEGKFDVVIAESKSGDENKPNKVWREQNRSVVEYLIRFVGLCKTDQEIEEVASALSSKYCLESGQTRYRYVIFSNEPNKFYCDRGITFMTYRDIVRFLVEVRGQCWITENIGVASIHYQWSPLINEMFSIANNQQMSVDERCEKVLNVLTS